MLEQVARLAMDRHYVMLGINLTISTIIMYFVMFSMIDSTSSFFHNINMFYMALTMVAPMGMLMLLTMGSMYQSRRLNLALHAGLALLFVAALLGTRSQAAIGDAQFLRSMIPHHSGAVLMCREAPVRDPEIVALCGQIIESQQREIEQMKHILERL